MHTIGENGNVIFGEGFKFESICRDSLRTSDVRFRVYRQTYGTLQSCIGEINVLFSDIASSSGAYTVAERLQKTSKYDHKHRRAKSIAP